MKGKSLLKKIGAAVTTVAMLASVSVVGFAVTDNAPEDGNADNFVSTNKVTGAVGFTENTTTNAFDFVVDYTQNSTTDNIGVTMLAYKVSTGDAIANGYTRDGADVVGIAQNGFAEATKKFTFSVAKGDEARELDYGDEVIVLLSSDGAANAVGYLTKIVDTTDAVEVNGTTFEVELPYYEASDAEKVKAALNAIANLSVDVTIGEGTTENVSAVGITAVGTPVCTESAWTVEVTLEEITGKGLSVAAGKKVTVPVTVNKTAWTATSATIAADIIPYDSEAEITEVPAMLTAITNLVKDGSHSITFTGADGHTVDWAVPANATVAWKGETPTTIEQGETYTVTVTLAEALTLDDVVATAPQGLAADFTITYQADTRKEAVSAKAFKGETEVTAIADFSMEEGATVAVADILTYVKSKIDSYKVYDDADPANAGVATASWKLYTTETADTEATGNVVVDTTYWAVATVTPSDATEWKNTTVTLKFAVEAVEAPAYIVGDANQDGVVNGRDWQTIANHLSGNIIYEPLRNTETLNYKAANVNGGALNGQDWQIIANALTGNIPNAAIGKPAQ